MYKPALTRQGTFVLDRNLVTDQDWNDENSRGPEGVGFVETKRFLGGDLESLTTFDPYRKIGFVTKDYNQFLRIKKILESDFFKRNKPFVDEKTYEKNYEKDYTKKLLDRRNVYKNLYEQRRNEVLPWWTLEKKQDALNSPSVAIVISNSHYHGIDKHLNMAHIEGVEIAKKFKSLGFIVVLKENLTSTKMRRFLSELNSFFKSNNKFVSQVIFYYTGHGVDICKNPAMVTTEEHPPWGHVHEHHRFFIPNGLHKHFHSNSSSSLEDTFHEHSHESAQPHTHFHVGTRDKSIIMYSEVDKVLPKGSIIIHNSCRTEVYCDAHELDLGSGNDNWKHKDGMSVFFMENTTNKGSVLVKESPLRCPLITSGGKDQTVKDDPRFESILEKSLSNNVNNPRDLFRRLVTYAHFIPTKNKINKYPNYIKPRKQSRRKYRKSKKRRKTKSRKKSKSKRKRKTKSKRRRKTKSKRRRKTKSKKRK